MLRRLLRAALGPPRPGSPAPSVQALPRPRVSARAYPLGRTSLREWPDTAFDASFLRAARDGSPEALREVVREVHPGLYALTPLSPERLRDLSAEIGRFHAWCRANGAEVDPPNSMNTYGAAFDFLGVDSAPLRAAVAPFARLLFTPQGGAAIDEDHTFIVSYARGYDIDLGFHADDAEVTLNLCLGDTFAGGDLYFEGQRCEAHRQTGCSDADRFVWRHTPGVALLHAGAHRHGALPLTEGARNNLIVWMRSRAYRADPPLDCPPWCAESRAR